MIRQPPVSLQNWILLSLRSTSSAETTSANLNNSAEWPAPRLISLRTVANELRSSVSSFRRRTVKIRSCGRN